MEEKNNNVEEKEKFKITQLYTNKRYYAIANLVFYSVLIIGLIIFVRMSPENVNDNTNIIENKSSVSGFEKIKSKNFNFKYIYTVDGVDDIYEGKQYNNSISFTDGKKEYFSEEGLFFEKENEKYLLSDFNPVHFNFFDVDLIEKIILDSSKSGNTYEITLSKLNELIDEKNSEINNLESKVIINLVKSNDIVTEISFDLSQLDANDIEKKLTLQYSNFGLIEEFSIKNN